MILPVIFYYVIFHYFPMYGAIIAFKDYAPGLGIWGSRWVGLKHFMRFFDSSSFHRVVVNTITISVYQIILGFPAPIILALLLNEVRSQTWKRTVQTITYMPHFISVMVVAGMLVDFLSTNGVITSIYAWFGGPKTNMLMQPAFFRTIYISSGLWQDIGFGSIVYLGGLSAIDPNLYEAAMIDGAGRWRQTVHITLPGILPMIAVLFILRMGRIMSVGYEKLILLYNPNTYEVADVISTFVYRRGLLELNYGFGAAVDLFNSFINMVLLVFFNWISRITTEQSLW